MPEKRQIISEYIEYDGLDELASDDQLLVHKARQAAELAYAPYSKFLVGAAVQMENGECVSGSNKENASFSAGICAERNVLSTVSDAFPGLKVESMAIYAHSLNFEMSEPVSPCGICRQVIAETEKVQKSDIKLILNSKEGKTLIFKNSQALLPFHFYVSQLTK